MTTYIKLLEKTICKKQVYKGGAVNFNTDTVSIPNNKRAVREYLDHPGAVAALPIIGNCVVMVRQFRYPVKEVSWEIPAGKLHSPKDNPIKRIKKELKEETGYTAKTFKKLLTFWPCCAFSNEILHIYVAKNLKPGKPSPDEDEFIQTKIISFNRALNMIKTGNIKDSKTIIALLAYKKIK